MSEYKKKDNIIENSTKKNKKKKIHYSLLTFVLIICIVELAVSAVNNINKNINFVSKIRGLESKRNEELDKNKQLKSELEKFNSETTLESIARNNLKMAGENEILLIINKPKAVLQPDENTKDKKDK